MRANPCTGRDCAESGSGGLAQTLLVIALDLAPQVPIAYLAPPVAAFLPAGEGQLHLGARSLEVDAGGDQGEAALRCLAHQALYLVSMQEELSRPLRLVVLAAG